ncbi:Adenosine/AMP deaminase family protein [Brugia pahangi]|uniref:A_deaminase domain-containing protein n=1 Tax=Brugia pahangi TaxID=6280 RepID=A0A0N4TYB2_BRUPA|nr:unnamed protein product [Brugia pahangi]
MLDLKLFCKKLPKCEFNIRWEACIKKSMLSMLEEHRRKSGGPELTAEQRKLLWAYGEPRDMKEALRSMSVVRELILLQEDVFTITSDIVDRYHSDNVFYLEFRVKPCVSNELSPETFLRKMIQAIVVARDTRRHMTIKILIIVELENPIEVINEIIDLVMILGRTYRSRNLPDSDIIHGLEMAFSDSNKISMDQLQRIIDHIRRESQLIIVFNLAKINNNVDQLYDILLCRPDRLSNAEILSTFNKNENKIDQHILTDRLISTKLPIEFCYTANRLSYPNSKESLWRNHFYYLYSMEYPIIPTTGYSALLGCSLSDEYYHLAVNMNLKPSDLYKLSLTASFLTEETPRLSSRDLFPFMQQYDEFAKQYALETSIDWKFQILRNCHFFLSRPLTARRKHRRRRIIDLLYS